MAVVGPMPLSQMSTGPSCPKMIVTTLPTFSAFGRAMR
jgi:hypothetical protein